MTSLSEMVLCWKFFHDILIQFSLEEGIRRIDEEEKKKDKCRLERQIKQEYNVQSRCACVEGCTLGSGESRK